MTLGYAFGGPEVLKAGRVSTRENVMTCVSERENKGALSRRTVLHAGTTLAAASAFSSGATAQIALTPDIVWHASKLMEAIMPLARIDVSKDAPPERIKVVSEAIYSAMVEIANVPLHDKFQVVTRHAADEIIYPKEGYLGLTYTGDLILIQITWVGGRSIEVKKKFYKRIADEIHERTGVRKEDVWINLVDDAREDWSFGNGEMQYAPK
jgi:4-oxalocrotonate tautomerase